MSYRLHNAQVRLRGRLRGQAMVETLVVTLVLVVGVWGLGWMDGSGQGALAQLVSAMRDWHARYAAALSLPV